MIISIKNTMIIDSHCHLDFKELQENFSQILANAKENDIAYMQTICTKISEFAKVEKIAQENDNIFLLRRGAPK